MNAVEDALALIDAWEVGFVAAAVVDSNGLVAQRGDTTQRVRIASLTKPLVGYAALIAIEEGIVGLDEPIGAIDGVSVPLGLTLRQLLAHAGGYGFDSPDPLSPPGLRRMYSNTGFELIGRLLAAASEMTIGQYLTDAVLAPLAMTTSSLQGSPAKDVWSTVSDYTRFVGELVHPRLIAQSTFDDFVGIQWPELVGVVPGLGSFRPCPWGLGIEIRGHKVPHWTGLRNSPPTYGHFGGSGTFFWVDPNAACGPLGLVCFTDREYGPWSLNAWPALSDAVLTADRAR